MTGEMSVFKVGFDPAEPAGNYELDLAEAYSRCILIKLIQTQQAGKGMLQKLFDDEDNMEEVGGGPPPAGFYARLQLSHDAPAIWAAVSDGRSIDQSDWAVCPEQPRGIRLPVLPKGAEPLTQT
eukprot:CAMPEP_0113728920 /NCGR_PEP_ID=MMETSP0038_2-20120614/42218_1 /TAXON_ID=2898 /ORGANISM="Cryptomonas paramecium" /LENGTH=123 /DNA_ID=CAMNT_0000660617 /DNA_START=24 /DNA_END=391 /DNA_ORIENTATION=+ /assembly_acc=CAM_ASM_000170